MKSLFAIVLAAALLALTGCATLEKGLSNQSALVQALISANVPANFNGPVEVHVKDMYNQFDLVAKGLHKDAATSLWVWDGLKLDNHLTIPWFSGLNYSREVHVLMGTP